MAASFARRHPHPHNPPRQWRKGLPSRGRSFSADPKRKALPSFLHLSPRGSYHGIYQEKVRVIASELSERETAQSAVTWTLIPGGLSEGESPPPRREPHGGRGENQTNLACGAPEAPTPAAPKLPGDLSSAPSRCPNLSQPTELKHAAQVREPRASSVPAPSVPYLPQPPGRAAHGGGGREARARDLGSPGVQAALGLLRGPCSYLA